MRDWTDAKTNTSIPSAAKPLLMCSRVIGKCCFFILICWQLPEFSKQTDSQQ